MSRFIGYLFCLLVWSQSLLADDVITFSTLTPKSSPIFKGSEELLAIIAEKMGVEIELIFIPGKRSSFLLSTGEIHAEIARISEYSKKVPFAIKVPTPIIEIPHYAYSLTTNFKVQGWESLKPYRSVSQRGLWVISHFMQDYSVHLVDSMAAAFQFMRSGRAELCIASIITAEIAFNSPGFNRHGIIRLQPAIYVSREHTFFAQQYPELARRYNEVLIELKNDGTFDRILSKVSAHRE